jgi:hypothetical protein
VVPVVPAGAHAGAAVRVGDQAGNTTARPEPVVLHDLASPRFTPDVVYDLPRLGIDPAERRDALRFYVERFGVAME